MTIPITPKPPYISPKFPARYRPLVDSLSNIVRAMPDSLLYQRPSQDQSSAADNVLASYDPASNVMRLSPEATDPTHRLAHEFGHLLQYSNQPALYDWQDSTHSGRDPTRQDLEQFAEDFANQFRANRLESAASLLGRILARQRGTK